MGGDEFCVLVTGADAPRCDVPLDRLKTSVTERNADPQRRFQIEYSVGMVEFLPEQHESIEDLLRIADERMYQMKSRD
jgi:diguanylate cyclase (GGDEF)-like protein